MTGNALEIQVSASSSIQRNQSRIASFGRSFMMILYTQELANVFDRR